MGEVGWGGGSKRRGLSYGSKLRVEAEGSERGWFLKALSLSLGSCAWKLAVNLLSLKCVGGVTSVSITLT